MKSLMTLFLSIVAICCLSACEKDDKDPFMDKIILDEFTLEWHEDAEGNRIHVKPNDLPQDIILVFREDFTIGGQIASFRIYGTYSLEPGNRIKVNLSFPELPILYEWDEIFLNAAPLILNYEYDGGNYLKMNYDNGNKSMLLSF